MSDTDPPPSRWGKINSGQRYHVITSDLDCALAALHWRAHELRLFQHVRACAWGSARPIKKGKKTEWTVDVVCQLSLYELARDWGVDYSNLKRAYRDLVDDRILIELGDGIVVPNKNLDLIPPERFPAGAIEYAKAQWPDADRGHSRPPNRGRRRPPNRGHSRPPNTRTGVGADPYPESIPPDPPIGERRAARGIEFNKHEENQSVCEGWRTQPEIGTAEAVRRIVEESRQPERVLPQVASAVATLIRSGYTNAEILLAAEKIRTSSRPILSLVSYLSAIILTWRQDAQEFTPLPPAEKPPAITPRRKPTKRDQMIARFKAYADDPESYKDDTP